MNNMNAVDYLTKKANDNGVFDINQNRQLNTDLSEEQKNKIAKNAFINPNYNKAGISNTFVEGLTDRSKYDYDINWNDNPFKSNDVGDLRAEAQGNWGRLKDAAINNITIAGTTALSSSIGLAGGVVSALVHGDASKIWDNDFNNTLNDFQKGVLNNNQIYKGQTYQNKSFLGKATDPIFWAELFQNAGYMEGMLIPGTALGAAAKATQIASKFPFLTKVVTNAIAAGGEASMEAINQRDESYNNLFNQATDIYRNKLTLANNDVEKQEAYNNYLQDLQMIDNDVRAQGNRTFAGNMIILTATGTLEFGDFISRGYGESHKLLKRIARNELGQATAKGIGTDIAKGTGAFVKNFTIEGLEEYTQRGAASGAANTKNANQFLSKYADELNVELADNYLEAVGKAWVDDFDNEEAWLEFLSGAIMGGIGIPGSHNGIRAQISDLKKEGDLRRNLAKEVNELEGNLNINPSDLENNGKLQETFDFIIREQGIKQRQNDALYNRDKNEFVNTRVEDILNYAMLYDNIGELDEFKERLKQYSKIDNQEQLTGENGLVKLTQDSECNSPFKDKSIDEVNKLLKESYDFWNKTIDDFINGKQILDNISKGKLDNNTLKRGAISFAQSRNFKDRAGELYNDLNGKLDNYQQSIIKISGDQKDSEFINNFFEGIKNLTENEVLPIFGSTKTVSSIYALTDFVNRNSSKIDSEIMEDIINPIVDLIKVSYDYYAYNNDFNSILKNSEKEQNKTEKIFNNIKNVKKNYLIKKYAKRIDGLSNRNIIKEQIEKIPSDIREDVIDYLKENGSESTRKTFDDIQEWDNVSRAITKVVDSFDGTKFPVNRKKYDDEYGNDVVDNAINVIKNAFNNSNSKDDIISNVNSYIDNERETINAIEDLDDKLLRKNNLKKTEKLLDDILNKIDTYSNNERNEYNKKKKNSKKKKENIDLNEEEESDNNQIIEFDIPNYIIDKYVNAIKKNDINKIKEYLNDLKNFDTLAQMYKMAFRLKKDETGNKNKLFLEQVLNTLEGKKQNNTEGQTSEDSGYDGKTSETPATSINDLKGLQPSQDEKIQTEDNTDENDKSEPEEQSEVNTLLSMAISKYNHEYAAKGRKKLYDENNSIYKLIEEYGGYDFVDNCQLDDFIKYCNKNKIDLTSVIKFIKTSVEYNGGIDNVYILAIEADNKFFEGIAKKTPEKVTKKINIDGKNYQVIGTMQRRENSTISKDEFNKLKNEIDKVGDVEVGQFKLSPLTNGISKVNAGRLVFANSNRVVGRDNNNVALSTLLKDIPNEDFEIGVYTDDRTLKLYDSVDSKKLVKPVSPIIGSVYLFVRCADGRYYPRLIRSKKLTANELNLNDAEDGFIKEIKDCIRTMCDPSVSDERLKAKDELADLIAFTTDKYKVSDLIWFEGDNIIVGNSAGERVKIKANKNDETVDRIFNAIINLPDLKLTPRIHIGGTGNYNALKNLLRKSTIVTSDVEMRSIDCNFELFITDENCNVVKEETVTSTFTKGKKAINTSNIFSFNSNQIKEITSKFKKYLPADLMNIESIAVIRKSDDNDTTFDFLINNSELLDESYDLYNILNWIYNQIQSNPMPDYSFNEDYEILFKASRNSNNTYSLKTGKNAVNEFNKLVKTYNIEQQKAAASNIPNKADISSEETEKPKKDNKVQMVENDSPKELGSAILSEGRKPKGQFDSIYKGNTEETEAKDKSEECNEINPL